jgi:acyl dehydratase
MAVDMQAAFERTNRLVGQIKRTDLGEVTRLEIGRFAIACGDSSALFLDDEFARSAGYPGIIAPPLYLSSIMTWGVGPAEEQLKTDGLTGEETMSVPVENLRIMGGGQELEFHQPVAAGTHVFMETSIETVQMKEGRSGTFLVVQLVRKYYDSTNRLLTTCRENFIVR